MMGIFGSSLNEPFIFPQTLVDRSSLVSGIDQPTLTNTGVLPEVSRSNYGGSSTVPNGTYENLNFLGGNFSFGLGGTFNNCLIEGDGASFDALGRNYTGNTSVSVFTDCTIKATWDAHTNDHTAGGHVATTDGWKGHHVEFWRSQILNVNDGLFFFNSVNPSTASGVRVEQSWIGKLAFWRPETETNPDRTEGTHNDCIAINDGTGIILRGNTIWAYNDETIGDATLSETALISGFRHGLEPKNDPEQWCNGAGIFIRRSIGSCNDFVIDKNWIYGGQIGINVSGNSGNVDGGTITGNRFGNVGTIHAGLNDPQHIWYHTSSYTNRTDVSGNVQLDGNPANIAFT